MAVFLVEATEKFVVHTTYFVKAANKAAAVKKVRDGEVPYEKSEIQEGDEEWLEVRSCGRVSPPPGVIPE